VFRAGKQAYRKDLGAYELLEEKKPAKKWKITANIDSNVPSSKLEGVKENLI